MKEKRLLRSQWLNERMWNVRLIWWECIYIFASFMLRVSCPLLIRILSSILYIFPIICVPIESRMENGILTDILRFLSAWVVHVYTRNREERKKTKHIHYFYFDHSIIYLCCDSKSDGHRRHAASERSQFFVWLSSHASMDIVECFTATIASWSAHFRSASNNVHPERTPNPLPPILHGMMMMLIPISSKPPKNRRTQNSRYTLTKGCLAFFSTKVGILLLLLYIIYFGAAASTWWNIYIYTRYAAQDYQARKRMWTEKLSFAYLLYWL